MKKLSVAIITKNEELNIERCLQSLSWVDEIIVVDSDSIDKTREICEQYGAKVIISDWLGFGRTKQFVVENCKNQWILSLDADEVITDELKHKIQKILENPQFSGYRIKRKSYYLGKMIHHCGWDKDYTLRLFEKTKGRFNDKIVHESVVIADKKIGKIDELILHYTYPTVESHVTKMISYAKLGAKQDFDKGKKSSVAKAVLRGLAKFIKMFVLQKGFLDGKAGFILSYNSAFGVYLKYLYLWELRNARD